MELLDFNRMLLTQYLHIKFPLEDVIAMGLKVGDSVNMHVDVYSQPVIFVFHHTKTNEAVFHPIQSLN